MNENFGEYLKGVRTSKELTLVQLSDLSGMSIAQLSRMENGLRGMPKAETLKKISTALDVPYPEMLLKAGYLDDLTPKEIRNLKESDIELSIIKNAKKTDTFDNATELVSNIEMTNDDLKKSYTLSIDETELTEKETQMFIDFIRAQRRYS